MHHYQATIAWQREGQRFTDQAYSRAHTWRFDGGAVVAASSSPSIVPLPMSVAAHVDPEEVLVAAAASCHMLFFLSLAAGQGYVVDRYQDTAFGEMGKNAEGKMAITRIVLRPDIQFSGEQQPDMTALRALHHEAHARCFIANSLKASIEVEC